MFERQTFIHSTLVAALLSAMSLSLPAHAGLLGGATSVTGGLGAGFGGGSGAGRMDIGGATAGQASARQGAFLPRGEDFTRKAGGAEQATSANISEQGSASRARAGSLGSDVTGAGIAGANLSRDAAQRAGSAGTMNRTMGAGGATAADNNHDAATSSRQADASANGSGSAQASGENVSVESTASAQGSVSR